MNLGFYIDHSKDSKALALALILIEHQVFKCKASAFFDSIILFQSLSQIFRFINE